MDAYERDRCVILGLVPPPTGIGDLQQALWQAKEEERTRAHAWLYTLEICYTTEEYGERQRSVAKFDYQRCQWVTDLAQMLLDAAIAGDPGERRRRAA